MIDGKWQLTTSSPRGDVVAILEVKADGGAATGSLSNDDGSVDITQGKFDGKELTYRFEADLPPLGHTKAKVALTFDGETLKGKTKLLIGSFDVVGVRID